MFEYDGMHLKTDDFKLNVSLKALFNRHISLEGVVLLECLLHLTDNLLLLKQLFHSHSASPSYTFFDNGLNMSQSDFTIQHHKPISLLHLRIQLLLYLSI